MSEKKQWTVEECSNLIEIYRKHPNLWNTSHIDYKNRMKKYDSLKEIAQQFETKHEEIERKMKNLISQYQRERRNYKKLKKLGAGHTFKAKWFGYSAMCFLHDKNKPIEGSQSELDFEDSNPSCSEDSNANESQMCELRCNANENHLRELDGNVLFVKIENQEQQSELLELQETEPITTPTTTQEDTKKRPVKQHLYSAPKTDKKSSKLVDTDDKSTPANEAFQMMKSLYQKTQTFKTRDRYSILGELVEDTIRNLKTDFSKATVEHQIHNILYEAQIGKYDFPQ
ncbi:uncharacterized protein [Leptinotarsa decemlineata]|uniref:uncharacterized protein n=1 Tax=Leptinotarsa decemlineata TaxID=7539 RepID=UPI003D3052BF